MDWPYIYGEPAGRPFLATTEEWYRRTGRAPAFTDSFALANYGIWLPVWVPRPMTVKRLAVLNGSAVAGNVEAALYEGKPASVIAGYLSYQRPGGQIVTSGAVAQAGTNQFQIFNTTDKLIAAGWYYLAVQFTSSSAKYLATAVPAGGPSDDTQMMLAEAWAVSSAPLPASASGAGHTYSGVPLPVIALSGVA